MILHPTLKLNLAMELIKEMKAFQDKIEELDDKVRVIFEKLNEEEKDHLRECYQVIEGFRLD